MFLWCDRKIKIKMNTYIYMLRVWANFLYHHQITQIYITHTWTHLLVNNSKTIPIVGVVEGNTSVVGAVDTTRMAVSGPVVLCIVVFRTGSVVD